jgi:hypothetical protein
MKQVTEILATLLLGTSAMLGCGRSLRWRRSAAICTPGWNRRALPSRTS